jgi:hypothetical protein
VLTVGPHLFADGVQIGGPLAATGAVLLFVGAVIMRLRRGERATIAIDLTNLAMAAFVAWAASVPGPSPRAALLPGRADDGA